MLKVLEAVTQGVISTLLRLGELAVAYCELFDLAEEQEIKIAFYSSGGGEKCC